MASTLLSFTQHLRQTLLYMDALSEIPFDVCSGVSYNLLVRIVQDFY